MNSIFCNKKNSEKKLLEILNDNKATLKYTLFLDTPLVSNVPLVDIDGTCDSSAIIDFVDNCFASTNEICRNSGIKPSTPYFNKDEKSNQENNDFSSFDKSPVFWEFIFKQHAVISAYEKTRKLIASLNEASIATLNFRNLKDGPHLKSHRHKPSYGMSYLLTKKINRYNEPCATLSDSCEFKCDNTGTDSIDDEDNNYKTLHTNTSNTAKTLYKNISSANIKALKGLIASCDDYRDLTALNVQEFFNCTIGVKGDSPVKYLPSIYNKEVVFDKAAYKNYCNSRNAIYKRLESGSNVDDPLKDDSHHCNFTLADQIHAKQLIEEVFGFDMIDCLYQNIENDANKEFLKNYLPMIAMCYNLPNVYSRHHILQMAVDNLKYNFVNDSKLDGRLIIRLTSFSEDTNQTLQRLMWLDKFTRMIKTLCQFTFPVYESHFFNTLWESISVRSESPLATLKNMFLILNSYLDNEKVAKDLLVMDEPISSDCVSKQIKPFFSNSCHDTDLYNNCLQEFLNYAKTSAPPIFISPEHIISLNKDVGKLVRRTYLDLASDIV